MRAPGRQIPSFHMVIFKSQNLRGNDCGSITHTSRNSHQPVAPRRSNSGISRRKEIWHCGVVRLPQGSGNVSFRPWQGMRDGQKNLRRFERHAPMWKNTDGINLIGHKKARCQHRAKQFFPTPKPRRLSVSGQRDSASHLPTYLDRDLHHRIGLKNRPLDMSLNGLNQVFPNFQ